MTDPSNTSVTAQFGAGERGEPVAWRWRYAGDIAWTLSHVCPPCSEHKHVDCVPLYAAPVSHTSVKDGGGDAVASATTGPSLETRVRAETRIPLIKIAAACHRSKSQFSTDEESLLPAAEARRLVQKAFYALHDIGDMAHKAAEVLRSAQQPDDPAPSPEQPTGSDAVADGAWERATHALRKPDASLQRVPNTVRQSLADVIEDQRKVIDKYGLALMMIGQGCADPEGIANRTLADVCASSVTP